MFAERFGSYSIAATFAGTPNFSRRKSILPVAALVPAAAVPGGDAPVRRCARRVLVTRPSDERALRLAARDLGEVRDAHAAPAGRGGLVVLDAHGAVYTPSKNSIDLALGQAHDRLLPLGLPPHELPDAPRLARHAHGANLEDLHVEEPLDRASDLVLVRARIDRERHDVLLLASDVALLRDERSPDHVVDVHACRLPRQRRRAGASMASTAALVSTSFEWRSTS